MEKLSLNKLDKFPGRDGPLVLIIMDGVGLGENNNDNAFYLANTPYLDELQEKKELYTELQAHGKVVGLPTDEEMGNSEVGHNAIGAGNVVKQRAVLAKEAIEQKSIFEDPKWKKMTEDLSSGNNTLHFLGLLSDGYVHSHLSHLFGLLYGAMNSNIKNVRVHTLLDGRDVPPQSSPLYIQRLEQVLKNINEGSDLDYKIASGGGRMRVTMDRYESDWEVVRRGWDAHVCAIPEKFPSYKGYFNSAEDAINQARIIDPDISDQVLPSFVVVNRDKFPVGQMENGDYVINFNFRGDRAIQISQAFDQDEFSKFEKKCDPDVDYYGLLQYDDVAGIPKKFFIDPPKIDDTLSEYLSASGVPMYAIAETFKFGHVQYFWEGNRDLRTASEIIEKNGQKIITYESKLDEIYVEVKSDPSEIIKDEPKMKAYYVLDTLKQAIISNRYKFLRVNFANGDMVGHTGSKSASMIAAETVDDCVKEVVDLVSSLNGITIITADHGNLEDMSDRWETSHTLNPVMFSIRDEGYKGEYEMNQSLTNPSLGNIAATVLNLLGYEKPNDFMDSLIQFK